MVLVVLGVEPDESVCGVQRLQEDQDQFDEVLMLPAQPQCAMTDTLAHVETGVLPGLLLVRSSWWMTLAVAVMW